MSAVSQYFCWCVSYERSAADAVGLSDTRPGEAMRTNINRQKLRRK